LYLGRDQQYALEKVLGEKGTILAGGGGRRQSRLILNASPPGTRDLQRMTMIEGRRANLTAGGKAGEKKKQSCNLKGD